MHIKLIIKIKGSKYYMSMPNFSTVACIFYILQFIREEPNRTPRIQNKDGTSAHPALHRRYLRFRCVCIHYITHYLLKMNTEQMATMQSTAYYTTFYINSCSSIIYINYHELCKSIIH